MHADSPFHLGKSSVVSTFYFLKPNVKKNYFITFIAYFSVNYVYWTSGPLLRTCICDISGDRGTLRHYAKNTFAEEEEANCLIKSSDAKKKPTLPIIIVI